MFGRWTDSVSAGGEHLAVPLETVQDPYELPWILPFIVVSTASCCRCVWSLAFMMEDNLFACFLESPQALHRGALHFFFMLPILVARRLVDHVSQASWQFSYRIIVGQCSFSERLLEAMEHMNMCVCMTGEEQHAPTASKQKVRIYHYTGKSALQFLSLKTTRQVGHNGALAHLR